jgi:hypothetical protein
MFVAATVGTPVTQRPPYSPGRAVFPHPVPRLHSHPRRVKPCWLWPAGRLAHAAPVRPVRDACPVRAACCRRDLPHVVGFPHLGVRRSIRLPNRRRWAFPVTGLLHLPGPWSPTVRRFQHWSGSGFPLPCLRSCRPYTVVFHGRNGWGLPRSSTSLFLPATACGLRRTCPSWPCRMGACGLRECSHPRRPHQAFSKLYQHCRGRGSPCGLQDALSTLRPSCAPLSRLRHGRKTRYGWVANPYPTRTFTLQETPSFSWRENASLQLLPEAGAERSKA